MNRNLLGIYLDYLIVQNHYASATGPSDLLDGEISHDRITRFLNKSQVVSETIFINKEQVLRNFNQFSGKRSSKLLYG